MKRLLAAIAALALLALPAGARLAVNNLSSFGARTVAAAGGGTPVVFQAGAAYADDVEAVGAGNFENLFSVSHTKDVDTTLILVAIQMPGQATDTQWPTAGTGTNVKYCGSAMTYVASSQVELDPDFTDNDNFQLSLWWLRGPSAGACAIDFLQDETAVTGGTGGATPPFAVAFGVLEFSEVISSGDPFEGVTTTTTSGVTGSITLTPTLGRMGIWASARDGSSTIGTTAPTVNFGTVDGNFALGTSYHHNVGHYDAAGSKTITLTWGAGVSRNAALAGFHLKPNP